MTSGNNVFVLFTNPPRANASFSTLKVKKSAIITKGRENDMVAAFLDLKAYVQRIGQFIGIAFLVASNWMIIPNALN